MPDNYPPPRYINAPVSLIYNPKISSGRIRTFLRIYGLYWNDDNPPKLRSKDWRVLTGLSRSSFYNHLNDLKSSGWLLFSEGDKGVLSFEFPHLSSTILDSSPENWTVAITLSTIPESNNIEVVNHSNADVQENGQMLVQENKKTENRRKKRDPLLNHPAVRSYRQIIHLTANHNQRREIAAAIGEADEALDRWRAALEHWSLHGWRPTNVGGMLDSYRNGGAAGCKMCRSVQSQAQPQATDNPTKPSTDELRAVFLEARREQERSKREADDVEAGQNP